MAENSKIEWCHHTFNPWTGCTKIGPGCDHCYAEGWAKRSGIVQWGPGAERRRTSEANWRQPVKWNAEAERLGVRYRVFCASLADVFDSDVPAHWRRDLFDLIEMTPHLDWLLVTKRIGNAPRLIREVRPGDWLQGRRNVWLGITVVNQAEADRDIPKLLKIPAAVRFLSMEPLLGPVDLRFHIFSEPTGNFRTHAGKRQMELRKPVDGGLHWVIVGGESGPGARPMHPQWVRDLRDQCAAAGVPMLFKQHGEWTEDDPGEGPHSDCAGILPSGNVAKCSEGYVVPFDTMERLRQSGGVRLDGRTLVFRVGKKSAGRLLDGVLHDGYPEAKP